MALIFFFVYGGGWSTLILHSMHKVKETARVEMPICCIHAEPSNH